VATLIVEVLFTKLLIRTAVQQVEHSWQQNIFPDDKYVNGMCGTIVLGICGISSNNKAVPLNCR